MLTQDCIIRNGYRTKRVVIRRAIDLLLIFFPSLIILFAINRYAVNVPYMDEWAMVPLVAKLHTRGFTLADFWTQHNEHRFVLPRLIMVALASLGGWNIVRELYASFLLALWSAVVLWRLLIITVEPNDPALVRPLTLTVSLLLFSAAQGENWIWGWELSWFLTNLFAIVAIWALARWPGRRLGFLTAALATISATYSLAGGAVLWVIILSALILQRQHWRPIYALSWTFLGAICIGLYFHNYHHPGHHPDLFYLVNHPLRFVKYILVYLGSALQIRMDPKLATAYSLLGVVALAVSVYGLWRAPGSRQRLLPWLHLILYAVGNAAITGVGRVGFGVSQALANRYTTVAALFWMGVFVIGSVALRTYLLQKSVWRRPVLAISSAFVAVLMWGYVSSYAHGYKKIQLLSCQLKNGLTHLYRYETAPDAALQLLFTSSSAVRGWARLLQSLGEGPFLNPSASKNRFHSERELVIEAEYFDPIGTDLATSWVSTPSPEKSCGAGLVTYGDKVQANYICTIMKEHPYYIWARLGFGRNHGSVEIKIDGQPIGSISNQDDKLKELQFRWIKYGRVKLSAGEHRITIIAHHGRPGEIWNEIDVLLLTLDGEQTPDL